MAKCTCRACGSKLDTKDAYAVLVNKRKSFYCDEEEYIAYKTDKRSVAKVDSVSKEQLDKDKVYFLVCDIIGRKEIINTALWKERQQWHKVASDDVIAKYLEDNKDYLTGIISKLDNVEYGRIRYLSVVLKNSIGDFKSKIVTESKPAIQVDNTFYEPVLTKNNKRRSLADLEDEF